MAGPEHNPTDDVQPTKEDWAEYERQLDEALWKCKQCLVTRKRKEWSTNRGILCCGPCLRHGYGDDTLRPVV